MAWTVRITKSAEKHLNSLDKNIQKRIVNFLRKIESKDNPRFQGKALRGKKADLWRYRIGDYRIICNINDETITVLVLAVGHRKEIYK